MPYSYQPPFQLAIHFLLSSTFYLILWSFFFVPDFVDNEAFPAISSQLHISFLVFITIKGPRASYLEIAVLPMVFWFAEIWCVEEQGTGA